MAKYGQMYLDGGEWEGRPVLDPSWIEESWQKYGRLRPLERNGHQYGYLWWHHVYEIGGQSVATLEARGNGGQYIFVVPSLDLVVVIKSDAENPGSHAYYDILAQVLEAASAN